MVGQEGRRRDKVLISRASTNTEYRHAFKSILLKSFQKHLLRKYWSSWQSTTMIFFEIWTLDDLKLGLLENPFSPLLPWIFILFCPLNHWLISKSLRTGCSCLMVEIAFPFLKWKVYGEFRTCVSRSFLLQSLLSRLRANWCFYVVWDRNISSDSQSVECTTAQREPRAHAPAGNAGAKPLPTQKSSHVQC